MNSILILPEEYQKPLATLRGERAKHVHEYHKLEVGLEVRAALLGQTCGSATVLKLSTDKVVLQLKLDKEPPARLNLSLLVAVPRPQTVKKIIHLAAACGVDELVFFKAESSVQSYLQSKSLRPENILREIIIGLEQSADCIAPKVDIIKDTRNALAWAAKDSGCTDFLLADSRRGISLKELENPPSRKDKSLLALGPESGWSEAEIEAFVARDFKLVGLGPRIYRQELAAAMLIGQLVLLG